jgi:protein transport protein SEC61 subunit gamma and related proteins
MDEAIKPTMWYKFKRFTNECIRVLKITKKPTKAEFKTIAKVSGLGILAIGLIGFLVQLIRQLLF